MEVESSQQQQWGYLNHFFNAQIGQPLGKHMNLITKKNPLGIGFYMWTEGKKEPQLYELGPDGTFADFCRDIKHDTGDRTEKGVWDPFKVVKDVIGDTHLPSIQLEEVKALDDAIKMSLTRVGVDRSAAYIKFPEVQSYMRILWDIEDAHVSDVGPSKERTEAYELIKKFRQEEQAGIKNMMEVDIPVTDVIKAKAAHADRLDRLVGKLTKLRSKVYHTLQLKLPKNRHTSSKKMMKMMSMMIRLDPTTFKPDTCSTCMDKCRIEKLVAHGFETGFSNNNDCEKECKDARACTENDFLLDKADWDVLAERTMVEGEYEKEGGSSAMEVEEQAHEVAFLESFYEKHNPSLRKDATRLLEKYKFRREEMYNRLALKYLDESTDFGTNLLKIAESAKEQAEKRSGNYIDDRQKAHGAIVRNLGPLIIDHGTNAKTAAYLSLRSHTQSNDEDECTLGTLYDVADPSTTSCTKSYPEGVEFENVGFGLVIQKNNFYIWVTGANMHDSNGDETATFIGHVALADHGSYFAGTAIKAGDFPEPYGLIKTSIKAVSSNTFWKNTSDSDGYGPCPVLNDPSQPQYLRAAFKYLADRSYLPASLYSTQGDTKDIPRPLRVFATQDRNAAAAALIVRYNVGGKHKYADLPVMFQPGQNIGQSTTSAHLQKPMTGWKSLDYKLVYLQIPMILDEAQKALVAKVAQQEAKDQKLADALLHGRHTNNLFRIAYQKYVTEFNELLHEWKKKGKWASTNDLFNKIVSLLDKAQQAATIAEAAAKIAVSVIEETGDGSSDGEAGNLFTKGGDFISEATLRSMKELITEMRRFEGERNVQCQENLKARKNAKAAGVLRRRSNRRTQPQEESVEYSLSEQNVQCALLRRCTGWSHVVGITNDLVSNLNDEAGKKISRLYVATGALQPEVCDRARIVEPSHLMDVEEESGAPAPDTEMGPPSPKSSSKAKSRKNQHKSHKYTTNSQRQRSVKSIDRQKNARKAAVVRSRQSKQLKQLDAEHEKAQKQLLDQYVRYTPEQQVIYKEALDAAKMKLEETFRAQRASIESALYTFQMGRSRKKKRIKSSVKKNRWRTKKYKSSRRRRSRKIKTKKYRNNKRSKKAKMKRNRRRRSRNRQ